jgi:YegS/Rv2252/BmrU family lipid kinase
VTVHTLPPVDRRFVVICNPSAGGGRGLKRLPLVTAELERLGVEHRVVQTRDIDHARSEAAVAAQTGERVVAIGGDGLLRPIAAVLRNTETSLAIVPGGRGNDLARVLGIPGDPTTAARLAVEGRERAIDMAVLDGEPFLGIASFGFDSEANRIANAAPPQLGRLVYVYGALRALAAWEGARFAVAVDGEQVEFEGWSVVVANSGFYGGGMHVAPHARLDDGALDVVWLAECSRAGLVRLLAKVFRGRHVDEPAVSVRRAAEVTVSADRPFTVYADGDPIGHLPITMRAVPAAVQVLLPA